MTLATTWRGTVLGLLAAAACLVAATLCTTSAQASTSPSPSSGTGVLRIGWLENPESLNPFVAYNGSDYEIFHLNYDYLVGHDPATMKPRPEFAESWTRSPDGLVWTFTIRHGMTWQDGQPATASDVAFTYNYIIDNQMAMFTSYTEGIMSVKALDDYTVEVRTAKPKPNMLSSVIPILPEHIWFKVDPKKAGTDYANDLLPHRFRAVPGGGVEARQLRAPQGESDLLARYARRQRDHLHDLHQPELDGG